MQKRRPANLKAKSRQLWIERGYHVANCETNNGGFKRDLFGIADLFCFPREGDGPTVFVQVLDATHRAVHLKLLEENLVAKDWLRRGDRIV